MNENEHEQHEKLREIANKIDANQDGKISRDEMHAYTEQRIKFVDFNDFDRIKFELLFFLFLFFFQRSI